MPLPPPDNTPKEGYFKFTPEYIGIMTPRETAIEALNRWRNRLYDAKLIGMYNAGELQGIGYGNISLRVPSGFLITATRTGGIQKLGPQHYTEVTHVSLESNFVAFRAADEQTTPSAESITHGMFYQARPAIQAVIHIHHLAFWQRLLPIFPTTAREIEYGTPAMGREILRLFRDSPLQNCGLVVMAGHEEGIVAFGEDLDEAGNALMTEYARHGFA